MCFSVSRKWSAKSVASTHPAEGDGLLTLYGVSCILFISKNGERIALCNIFSAFVALGVLGMQLSADKSFAQWIVAGLVMGLVGDLCLNLRYVFEKRAKPIFLAGIAAFLIGHILYLVALIPLAPSTPVYSVPAGIVAAAVLLILLKQIEVGGAIKAFGIIYIGVIVVMTAVATGLFISSPQSKGLLLFMIGAYLFTASDVVLVLNQFGKNKGKALRAVQLSLYYVGQLLIALSLQLF